MPMLKLPARETCFYEAISDENAEDDAISEAGAM